MHYADDRKKKMVVEERMEDDTGERTVPYGCVFFLPWDEKAVPVKVSRERWGSDWAHYWFYHKVDAESRLKSTCQADLSSTPAVAPNRPRQSSGCLCLRPRQQYSQPMESPLAHHIRALDASAACY